MSAQQQIDYQRIEAAIAYLKENFKEQPNLDEIARAVNLSPFHFQRLFTDWAGTSPKKFIQYLSIEHAKKLLAKKETTLFDAAEETGLSGSSRLHDLFIKIEGMTPAEYKNGGKKLQIKYSTVQTLFGLIVVASTIKGICVMAFVADEHDALTTVQHKFPEANIVNASDELQQNALLIFKNDWSKIHEIKLHLKASNFQLKVWEALLKIPLGGLASYGSIAQQVDNANASRAVGTAIGSNPVAFLIPCHRVIRASGELGGYMWGLNKKAAIIGWESAQILKD